MTEREFEMLRPMFGGDYSFPIHVLEPVLFNKGYLEAVEGSYRLTERAWNHSERLRHALDSPERGGANG